MSKILSRLVLCTVLSVMLMSTGALRRAAAQYDADRSWQPGDHHVHSRRSINYNWETDPPRVNYGHLRSAPQLA